MERLCASKPVVDHIRRFVSDYGFNTARVDGPCERIQAVSLLGQRDGTVVSGLAGGKGNP